MQYRQTQLDTLNTFQGIAQHQQHRKIILLAGDKTWSFPLIQQYLSQHESQQALWITDQPPKPAHAIKSNEINCILGTETQSLIYDAHCGFNPDCFGVSMGMVMGGGLIFLCTPELETWPQFNDPDYQRFAIYPYQTEQIKGLFLHRLVQLIQQDASITVLTPSTQAGSIQHQSIASKTALPYSTTTDQQQAIEAIIKVVKGHRRRPVVLTSDRGRGKSAALGIAAAQLIRHGTRQIHLTAPSAAAVTSVFKHAAQTLAMPPHSGSALHYQNAVIQYIAPDALLQNTPKTELLLIDEAAAIPTPMLTKLLKQYSRIVFATTLHGYEGTGRGFAIRFHKTLNQLTPNWKSVQLETPIRWASHDPVEAFVFKALALNASPVADIALNDFKPDECQITPLSKSTLLKHPADLNELFGLLVLAHYRTTPNDLRYLLDSPNMEIFIVRYRHHIIAATLVAIEGNIDPEMTQHINTGQRRPRGHLIPQSLAVHAGLKKAPLLSYLRIIRITVHPLIQRYGIGTSILEYLSNYAQQQQFDIMGSSFGVTPELIPFWTKSKLRPVVLGLTRDASSGVHSLMVLKALNKTGKALVTQARKRFLAQLPQRLHDDYQDIEPETVRLLLSCNDFPESQTLNEMEKNDLVDFVNGYRIYDVCSPAIWQLSKSILSNPEMNTLLNSLEKNLLMMKVLQKQDWDTVSQQLDIKGKKTIIKMLQKLLKPFVENH